MTYTHTNTQGYTDAGLRSLTKAHAIIVNEHGYDMAILPDAVATEINDSIRRTLTNTYGRNMSVRKLLSIAA